ncbi:NRDE family protein [Microbacterium sp. NPDC091313]
MCTVIVRVPADPAEPTRVLAVRDEDPGRAWDPPGHWWPELPDVVGVRDVRAGGAWLAADASERRLAVILNRHDVPGATASRGAIVLDAVEGRPPADPRTNGFNLVTVEAGGTRVTSWDGASVRDVDLSPGVHMIAHDDVDDPATPRIARWLPDFAASELEAAPWWRGWLGVLAGTARLDPTDDEAIVRDNRPHGVPTLSLLVCAASVTADDVRIVSGTLDRPGQWNDLDLRPPLPRLGG